MATTAWGVAGAARPLLTPRPRIDGGGPFGLSVPRGVLLLLGLGLASGLLAFLVAQAGLIAVALVVATFSFSLGLLIVKDKPLYVLVTLVVAHQAIFRKMLSPIVVSPAGPPGVFVSQIDLLLILLYVLWGLSGTLGQELGRALRQPLFYWPLIGQLAVAPSAIMADNQILVAGELVRVIAQYALFVYVALRVRTKRQVSWILAGYVLFVAVQLVIAVLQAKTGTTLGLDKLGAGGTTDGSLAPRTIDGGIEIPRPSGTILHAVLFGSMFGMVGMVALNLAVHLRSWWLRLLWLGVFGVGITGVVISSARAPMLGVGVAAPLAIWFGLKRRRLGLREILFGLVLAAIVVVALWDKVVSKITENIGTEHFWLEIESRNQLMQVSFDIWNSSPLLGVGINNSVSVLEKFEPYGVIFPGFPAHNIYLLVASEAGIVGLVGLLITIVALYVPAIRLARMSDRYLSAIGFGVIGVFTMFWVQETLVMAMRYDIPRTTFWLVAGLGIACLRMAQRDERRAPRKRVSPSPLPAEAEVAHAS